MVGYLRKLFAKSPASQPVSPATDRDTFLRELGEQDIFVIAAMQGDGIDPKGMTKEQLLAEIDRRAVTERVRRGLVLWLVSLPKSSLSAGRAG